MLRTAAAAALMLMLAWTNGVLAQAPKQPEAGKAQAPKQPEAAKVSMPDANQLAILVQTVVVAVSQANLTNNYTVLHALGSPDFQQANPPQKLADLFANMRAKKIDLTPVIIYSPMLVRPAAMDEKNMLRITGFYKTEPLQVHFDLLFQPVGGLWRLYGVTINVQPPQSAEAAPPPAAAAQPPAAAVQPPAATAAQSPPAAAKAAPAAPAPAKKK